MRCRVALALVMLSGVVGGCGTDEPSCRKLTMRGDRYPRFLRDGRRIVFERSYETPETTRSEFGGDFHVSVTRVMTANADGSDARVVLGAPMPECVVGPSFDYGRSQRLVSFAADKIVVTDEGPGPDVHELVDLATGAVDRLNEPWEITDSGLAIKVDHTPYPPQRWAIEKAADFGRGATASVADGLDPVIALDGEHIAFRTLNVMGEEETVGVVRADGSDARSIAGFGPPAFYPDSRRILFERYDAATDGIRLATYDLADRTTTDSGAGTFRLMLPDGRAVLENNLPLSVISLVDGSRRVVNDTLAVVFNTIEVWSPHQISRDGRYFLFTDETGRQTPREDGLYRRTIRVDLASGEALDLTAR